MVDWLNRLSSIPIKIAKDKEVPLPGHVYFAPDNFQMGVNLNRIELRKCKKGVRICPSVAHLFNNLAMHYAKDTIAMILTGMGKDGAKELKLLREKGAVTIAQDKESSLVHGMPGEAIKLGGAAYVLNPGYVSNMLLEMENYTLKKQSLIR